MRGCHQRRHFQWIDDFTRGKIIGLRTAGLSLPQIAADTHMDASTVHRLWRTWLEQRNAVKLRGAGKARVTSAPSDRRKLWRTLESLVPRFCSMWLSLIPQLRRQSLKRCRTRATWKTEWRNFVFFCQTLSCFCLSRDSRRILVDTWRQI